MPIWVRCGAEQAVRIGHSAEVLHLLRLQHDALVAARDKIAGDVVGAMGAGTEALLLQIDWAIEAGKWIGG